MSFNYTQFKTFIVDSTLLDIGLYSKEASILLLATMAQESNFGTYLHQVRGSARGVYQIEPATHKDVWENYLASRPELFDTINRIIFPLTSIDYKKDYFRNKNILNHCEKSLVENLSYATAIARLVYYRVPDALPDIHPVRMGKYWKQHYNTPLGKGTLEQFVLNWDKFILPHL